MQEGEHENLSELYLFHSLWLYQAVTLLPGITRAGNNELCLHVITSDHVNCYRLSRDFRL